MALSTDSLRGVARRKAQRARQKVQSAENELDAANEALEQAIPRRDVDAIAEAAKRTVRAEAEVHEAADELDAVDELLRDPAAGAQHAGASGEGTKSLLPFLGGGAG
jgi:hypothetical protein